MRVYNLIKTILFLFILLCYACEKEQNIVESILLLDNKNDTIVVDNSYHVKEIGFTTNDNWFIELENHEDSIWIKTNNIKGTSGHNLIKIHIYENKLHEYRTAKLNIKCKNKQESIVIVQEQKNDIILENNLFKVEAKECSLYIPIKSNINFNVLIPEKFKDWILNINANKSLSYNQIALLIRENTLNTKRTGFIIIESSIKTDTIQIEQEGQEILYIKTDYITSKSTGGITSIGIKHNIPITIKKEGDYDWIDFDIEDINESKDSLNLKFNISKNDTKELRVAEFAIISNDIEKGRVTILQYHSSMTDEIEAIDLGLSVKWSNINLGSTGIYDYGELYRWGVTKTDSIKSEPPVNYNISGTKYDIAQEQWKGDWRLPTKNEIKELIEECEWEWIQRGNISGALVKGKNGNQIFLPASGYYWFGGISERNNRCVYFSGESDSPSYMGQVTTEWIRALVCEYNGSRYTNGYRYYSKVSIRPVCKAMK